MSDTELVAVDFTINDPEEQEQGGAMTQEEQQHGEGEGADDSPTGDALTAGASGDLLSLSDIEKLIPEISYVTLCRYAQMYADELPSEGEGRKKRYYPEAVEVFRRKRAESTKGRKPGGAQVQAQAPTGAPDKLQDAPDGSIIRPLAPRRPGRPAGSARKAGKRTPAQKRAAGKRTQARGHAETSPLTPSSPAPSDLSASTLAMDRAVRELEIARNVTRLEALKWGIAPVQAEIARLEKLIAQAQGKVVES